MKKVLIFIIIIFFVSFKHPFYLGVVDLKYNIKDKALQGSVKLFTNDFETALKKITNQPIDLINGKNKEVLNKILFDYLKKHLNVKVNDKNVNYTFIGFEHETDATWMYIEFEKSVSPQKIEIENTLLYDYLKEQVNIVHIEVNQTRKV